MPNINVIFNLIINSFLELQKIYYDDDINYNIINNFLCDFLNFVNGDYYEI